MLLLGVNFEISDSMLTPCPAEKGSHFIECRGSKMWCPCFYMFLSSNGAREDLNLLTSRVNSTTACYTADKATMFGRAMRHEKAAGFVDRLQSPAGVLKPAGDCRLQIKKWGGG